MLAQLNILITFKINKYYSVLCDYFDWLHPIYFM